MGALVTSSITLILMNPVLPEFLIIYALYAGYTLLKENRSLHLFTR